MIDDPNKMADVTESQVVDDAVSNRSDDTALEHEAARAGESQDAGVSAGAVESVATDEHATDGAIEQDTANEVTDESLADESSADEEDFADGADDEADEAGQTRVAVSLDPEPVPEEIRMDWYILKVQSNRERSIAEAIERKIRVEGLDQFFDQVIVPTEKVTEFKGGKKKIVERKLYPGYVVVHMHINDETWFAVRETSGVGDFTGAGGKPTPMLAHEVARIVQTEEEEASESPKLDIKFAVGDKVKVKEGNFENFEGDVGNIDEASGRVTVMINIFGRSTPVELEYWQIEAV